MLCSVVSGGGSGCVGGGSVGGLGLTGPLLDALLPLLSLSAQSEDLQVTRSLSFLSLESISLHRARTARVSWFLLSLSDLWEIS